MGQRLGHIDALRSVAVLAVLLQHAFQAVQDSGGSDYSFLLTNINLGRFGVILFFLISGMVIPFSFRGENPLRGFIVGRFFRLYPMYWLSILCLGTMATWLGGHLNAVDVLANFTMFQGLWGGRFVSQAYWTLSYELVFYAFCAFLFWRRQLDDVALIGCAVLIGEALTIMPMLLMQLSGGEYYVTDTPFLFAQFLLGMVLRLAFVNGSRAARQWAWVLVPLTIAIGIAQSGWLLPMAKDGNVYLRPLPVTSGTVLPLIVFVLVLWLKPQPGRAITYLSSISYSMYLLQEIGLTLPSLVWSPVAWPIGYVLTVLAMMFVIASLTYRFVERPMIEFGRSLARPRDKFPQAPVPAT